MASYRPLEVTIISAKDLKDVNLISKLEVYAVVTISGDPRTRQRTPTDREGRKNPNWNCPLRFSIPVEADLSRLTLRIHLRCERALGDRDVGEVHVPLKELESNYGGDSKKFVSYQVQRPSGRGKGVLNFFYKFGNSAAAPAPQPAMAATSPPMAYAPPPQKSKNEEPVMAYPVGAAPYPHQGSSTAYPAQAATSNPYQPPPAGYPGYHLPPAYGYGAPAGRYGYPPVQPGYGYGAPPPMMQPQQPPRKNKFGMGLGAGLLGGALGGLLIGDMISDASTYDAGYDAGFDGGFGF